MKGAIAGYSRAWQNLTLTDASGQQLINLRRTFGAPLPTTGNPEAIVRVVRSGQPAIGNLSAGPVSGAPGIVVHVPVLKEGRVSHVLNAIFYPQPLSDLLLTQELPSGWVATIVDQNQIVAATNHESEKFFGKPAPRVFAAQGERHREIAWRGTADDGSGVVAALHRSSFSGWTVGLSSSVAVVDAPLRTLMISSATGGLFLLLVALGLAAALGRRIAAPVAALSHEAERLGRGNTPRPIPSAIVEIDRVARALEDAGNTRNEAERALRKSEKNLAGAQERARLGSWEYDIAARAGSWSAQMFRLFERDPTLGAPTLAEFLQMVHPDDRGLIEEAQARALQSDDEHSFEFRGATERYFSAILRATKDEAGKNVHLVGTVQDITQRKRNEGRIRQLNRIYAVLSDINQAIVRIRDPQALLATVCTIATEKGDFALAWFGSIDRETGRLEAVARAGCDDGYIELLTSAPATPQSDEPSRRALRDGKHQICNDLADPDLSAVWSSEAVRHGYLSAAAFPLKIGDDVVGVFTLYYRERDFFNGEELTLLDESAADIGLALEIQRNESERLRIEDSLRESEQRFRQLAENIDEVFWLSALDKSRIIYVSPGYERIWGRSCQSLYASPGDWLEAVHPDDRGRVLAAALHDQSYGTYDQKYRIVRPDGAIRWIHDRAFPVHDARGELYRIAGIADDITANKATEEALKKAHEELEERVQERTRELREANIKLRDLDTLKSQFLANMSHELRTPLNAIIGFSQLMHDGKAGGATSPEQKEYLRDILNSGNHLLQMINEVLDMSKIEAGRMEVLRSTFPIDAVILEVVHNIAPIMSVKGLKLIRDIPPDLALITTDRRKVLQILLNLASNAVKFTEHGVIGIRCENVRDKFRLSVWDTGIGIKPEELEFLFQPFSQLDGSLRKRHEGTGLGLYLSKTLATLLGGNLTVASKYTHGSTFTLTIPLTVKQ